MIQDVKKLLVKFNGRKVGILKEISTKKIAFQYDKEWIETGFSISPLYLPLTRDVYVKEKNSLDGLYGVFFDSLPDGWGNLLLRRKLALVNINYDKLSPLTKLSLVSSNGLGALEYEPIQSLNEQKQKYDLDKLAKDAEKLLMNNNDNVDIDTFCKLGGSSGGSRPKVHIKDGDSEWIVKFPCRYDPVDISIQEYNLNMIARECDIKVNDCKLFETKKGNLYFGAKRFDRKNGKRIHMVSLSSLLETSHLIPNLDYIHLFQVVMSICSDKNDLVEAYKRMCFNVVFKNKDDHGKNFAFIYDEEKQTYKLSPFYDLTSTIDKYEHEMTINGKGNPDDEDLICIGQRFGLSKEQCELILNNIKNRIHFFKYKI